MLQFGHYWCCYCWFFDVQLFFVEIHFGQSSINLNGILSAPNKGHAFDELRRSLRYLQLYRLSFWTHSTSFEIYKDGKWFPQFILLLVIIYFSFCFLCITYRCFLKYCIDHFLDNFCLNDSHKRTERKRKHKKIIQFFTLFYFLSLFAQRAWKSWTKFFMRQA